MRRDLLYEITKSNQVVQDARVEVIQIKRLWQKIKFKVKFELKAGHPKNKVQFENNSREYPIA